MNLICRIKGHDWHFSYNHGIPLGCSDKQWELLKDESYPVHECSRCRIEDAPLDKEAKRIRSYGRKG